MAIKQHCMKYLLPHVVDSTHFIKNRHQSTHTHHDLQQLKLHQIDHKTRTQAGPSQCCDVFGHFMRHFYNAVNYTDMAVLVFVLEL